MGSPSPETLVREYRLAREYQRDAARLQQAGWEVVSILERPAPPGRLRRTIGGGTAWLAPAEVERLVTYVWRGRERQVPRPPVNGAGFHAAGSLHWWWWLLLVLVLVLVLALGLLSFFGDNLLPS